MVSYLLRCALRRSTDKKHPWRQKYIYIYRGVVADESFLNFCFVLKLSLPPWLMFFGRSWNEQMVKRTRKRRQDPIITKPARPGREIFRVIARLSLLMFRLPLLSQTPRLARRPKYATDISQINAYEMCISCYGRLRWQAAASKARGDSTP